MAEVLRKLFSFERGDNLLLTGHRLSLVMFGVGLVVAFGLRNTWEISREPRVLKTLGLAALFAVCLLFLFGSVTHPFLYFQF
jgi:hypothetical protein